MFETFGWDLLMNSIKHQITKKSELLVAFVHWNIVSKNALCLGCSEEKSLRDDEKNSGSELLPNEWNNKQEKYTLRYLFRDKLLVLYGVDCGEIFLFNLLNVYDNSTTNIAMNVESTVKSLYGPLDVVINDCQEEIYNINKNLRLTEYHITARSKVTQTENFYTRDEIQKE